jgi:diguanylate cyclase (GGDEF)-like protein
MLITTTVNMYQNPLNGDIEALVYMFDTSFQYIEKKIQSLLIAKKFESVAVIDIESGKLSLMSQFLYIPESMSNATQQDVDYTPHIKKVAEAYVVPEEIDRYIKAAAIETIVDALEKSDTYSFTVASLGVERQKCYQRFTYYYLDEKRNMIVSVMEEVTEDTLHDQLTGLYNRRGFVREAGRLINANTDPNLDFAILFFNISDFQTVDELYGMDGGDLFLREASVRLKESFLKPFLTARSEADHFVCLVDVRNIDFRKLADLLDVRYALDGRDIELKASCGIYRVGDVTVDINKMCDRARKAEKSIEDRDEKPYAVYDISME